MRILYSHYLNDNDHPAVQMVQHIARELEQFGHTVRVHASAGLNSHVTDGGPERSRAIGIAALARRLLWFTKALARNRQRIEGDRRVLRDFAPDIVLARQDAYCWSVVQAAREANIPCVTYADAPVAYEFRLFNPGQRWHPPRLMEHIECWGLRKSAAIITVSQPAARRL